MYQMTKETRLNLRITDDFRRDIETLAKYHGLTLSSYAHSLLVRAIRREKEAEPAAFKAQYIAPVVATITPSIDPKAEIREMLKTPEMMPLSKRGMPAKLDKTNTQAKRRTR